MNYTAQSKEELLREIEAYIKDESIHLRLEDDCQGELTLMYVLIRKFAPEKTIVVAANENGGVFMLYPYDNDEFSEPWDFDADHLLFEQLGEGYEILIMTPEAHSDVWQYVTEMSESVHYRAGQVRYFGYCHNNGITKEMLERQCSYEGADIMQRYIPLKRERERER